MPVTASYLTYVIDQLGGARVAAARRMFGGVGLYQGELFFGAVDDDVVFLRVDDESRPRYVQRGMRPLRPVKSKPDMVMENYYEVPADVLDDADELQVWVRHAVTAAASAPRKPKAKKAKPRALAETAPKRKRAVAKQRAR